MKKSANTALRLSKNLWEVSEGPPSGCKSEASDMCGGFGSLAQQGFLTPFTGREHGSQVKGADSKKRRSHFFDTLSTNAALFLMMYTI